MKRIICIVVLLAGFSIILLKFFSVQNKKDFDNAPYKIENTFVEKENSRINKVEDWRLLLVNFENTLQENFQIELSNIDSTRQFDSRAIGDLRKMLNAMKSDGITNVWVQSAYRSLSYQTTLFENKVTKYISQGKTREEAEALTLKTINLPGTSEHHLGLAVDFNYVEDDFVETKGYQWLCEHAADYGFILRYPKGKEGITKVNYEPWHWRYVGIEHAKQICEKGFCLEEYLENENR